jgi:lia operon protein LiaG
MFPVVRPRSGPVSAGFVAAALGLAAFLVSPAAFAQVSREYTVSGDEVSIYNMIGEVRVVRGTGSSVKVEVTLGGDDAGDLRVETGTIAGRQTLRVIYPGDRFVYSGLGRGSNTQIIVNDDGTFGGGRNSRGRRVRISGGGDGLEAWADLTISVPDRKSLAVHQAVGGISASRVNADLMLDTSAAPVEATGIRGKLSIDVGSGRVTVSDVEGGPVSLDTGSGRVFVSGIRSSSLVIDTGSGEIEGSNIHVEDLNMDTGSGSIDLDGLSATKVLLDTGSGSVDIELDSDVENLVIDTGSGGVTLAVPDDLGAELRVSTGSGGIDVSVPHETYRHRRSEFTGRLGDGRGDIVIETGSGGVLVAGTRGR